MLKGSLSVSPTERLGSRDHLALLPKKQKPHVNEALGETTGNSYHKITLPQCFSNAASHCHNRTFLQNFSASPQFLFQCSYCFNVDVACNALQHYCNAYCYNAEAHCRNVPFLASLRQCCYCKGHCDNAFWYCRNTPTFSRCILLKV